MQFHFLQSLANDANVICFKQSRNCLGRGVDSRNPDGWIAAVPDAQWVPHAAPNSPVPQETTLTSSCVSGQGNMTNIQALIEHIAQLSIALTASVIHSKCRGQRAALFPWQRGYCLHFLVWLNPWASHVELTSSVPHYSKTTVPYLGSLVMFGWMCYGSLPWPSTPLWMLFYAPWIFIIPWSSFGPYPSITAFFNHSISTEIVYMIFLSDWNTLTVQSRDVALCLVS